MSWSNSGRYDPAFPAKVEPGAGIAIDRSALTARIRLDYSKVQRLDTPPASGLIVVQNQITGAFETLDLADLVFGGSGSGQSLSGTTAAAVSGQRALRLNLSGGLVHASASDLTVAGRVVGISRAAAIAGENVEYAFGGSMTDSAWNWSPGPIYLGENGTLTQAVPTSGVFYPLGTSDRPTRILISIGPSIQL